ncbi:hypothetical protein L7F22_046234 [Adiantum nelumboides]|nr:hypothetical protein [Adiantum nelumboides]
MPREIWTLHRRSKVADPVKAVHLKQFFRLPPWGTDYMRAHELMVSIQYDVKAMITDKDGVKIQVLITTDIVNEALHFYPETYDLIAKTKSIDNEKAFLKAKGSKYIYADMIYSKLELPLRIAYQALGMIEDLPTAGSQASLIQHARFVPKAVKTTTTTTSLRTTRSTKKSSSDDEKTNTDKDEDSEGSDKEKSQKRAEAKGPSGHESDSFTWEDEGGAQLALEKIKEALRRKAEGPILERRESSPKRPRQENEDKLENIQADPLPQSPKSLPPAPPSSPKTPIPPPSSPRTPPSPKSLELPKSPPAPTSPKQQQDSAEPPLVPPSSQPKAKQGDQAKEKENVEKKQADTAKPKPAAQYEARMKELEQELAQAKAELEIQKQRNKALSKEKEAVGSLASTAQNSQVETHLHVHLPPMSDMPDLLGTSQYDEEHQGPALGAFDVRGDIEHNIEDMPEGPAKEFLLHEKKVMESAALAFLQPEEQVKGFGHEFLPLPLMQHEAILWKEKIRPPRPRNEDEGYKGISLTAEQAQALVEDHPKWRKKWLQEWPNDLTNFHNTPQALQINPTSAQCLVEGHGQSSKDGGVEIKVYSITQCS